MALRNDINAQVKTDMINYNGASDGQAYLLLGETVMGDTPLRFYYYEAASTATVDGENVLPATGMGVGRFIKQNPQEIQPDWNQSNPTAADYLKNKPTIPPVLSPGTGISIVGNVVTNTSPDQTIALTAGRGITITGSYPNFTISLVTPTITIRNTANSNARAFNSNFTISSTKEADVTYTITCSATNPLLAGSSTANAFLEYSIDGGTTWNLPSQAGNSSAVGLTVTLQLTNGQTGTLLGKIPANALVRIRTATTGTASVTYITGQETYY